ncbi:MAG: hypothetical protein LC791_10155 [Acidobacteria bacterium]|nr:hypothetical protein [Acidobacteriota bacterium]
MTTAQQSGHSNTSFGTGTLTRAKLAPLHCGQGIHIWSDVRIDAPSQANVVARIDA